MRCVFGNTWKPDKRGAIFWGPILTEKGEDFSRNSQEQIYFFREEEKRGGGNEGHGKDSKKKETTKKGGEVLLKATRGPSHPTGILFLSSGTARGRGCGGQVNSWTGGQGEKRYSERRVKSFPVNLLRRELNKRYEG